MSEPRFSASACHGQCLTEEQKAFFEKFARDIQCTLDKEFTIKNPLNLAENSKRTQNEWRCTR